MEREVVESELPVLEVSLSSESVTVKLSGAGPARETVPVEGRPPTTEAGLKVTPATPGEASSRVPTALAPLAVAVTETVLVSETAVVVTGKFTERAPAGTLTWSGKPSSASVLVRSARWTVGTSPVMTTVLVRTAPPRSEVKEKTTEPGRLAPVGAVAAAWMRPAAVTAFWRLKRPPEGAMTPVAEVRP
jgi:hypothetical protein